MIPFDPSVSPEAMACEVAAAFRSGMEEVTVLARVDQPPFFSTTDEAVGFIKKMVSFATGAAIHSFGWGASGCGQYVSVDFTRRHPPDEK